MAQNFLTGINIVGDALSISGTSAISSARHFAATSITASSSTNRSIILDYTGGSGGYSWMSFKQSNTEQFRVFGSYTGDYLSFYNDQNSVGHQLTLAATGEVGVGTDSPLAKLDVRTSGNTAIPGLDAVPGTSTSAIFRNSSNTVILATGVDNANTSWLQGRQKTGTGNAFPIALNPLGGDVGIGTASPAKPLHISSADNQPLRVESTDAYSGIEIKDNGSSTLPPLISALSDDFIFYGGHGSTRPAIMFMDSSTGNVGIGETTPDKKLDVYTATNTDGIRAWGPATNLALMLKNTGSNGSDWNIASTGGGHGYGDGSLQFGIAYGVPKVTFKSDGTVGIGTYAPDSLLHLQSTGSAVIHLENTGNAQARIQLDGDRSGADNNIGYLEGWWNGTSVAEIRFKSGQDTTNKDEGWIDFLTAPPGGTPASRMVIREDGDVGIGLTSPASKLHIRTSTNFNYEFEEVSSKLRFSALNDARSANVPLEFAASSFGFLTGNATFAGAVEADLFKVEQSNTSTNITASTDHGIWLKNTSDTDGNFIPISFANSTGYETARIGAEFQDAGDRNTDLYFCTRANSGSLTEQLRISSTGAATFNSTITTSDVYGASSLRLAALGGTAYLDSGSGSSVIIRTNGTTTALTLDSSQNATFEGNVSVNGAGQKATLHVKAQDNAWESGILLEHNSGDTGWNIHPENDTNNGLWFGYNSDTTQSLTDQGALVAMKLYDASQELYGSSTNARFRVDGDVNVVGTTDFHIPTGRKLCLDGGGTTYLTESSDGVIDFYGDGVQLLTAKQNGTQSEVIVNEGSGDVDFRVEANNDTHAFFVEADASGKVGIGTNDPASRLSLKDGDLEFLTSDVSARLAKIKFSEAVWGDESFYIQHDGAGAGINNYLKIYGDGSGGTAGGVTISRGGNVGIGNGNPDFHANASNLVVGSGSGNQGITIYSGTSAGNYGSIYFADGRANGIEEYRGMITYEQNNEIMRFHTNSVEALKLDLNQIPTFTNATSSGTAMYIHNTTNSVANTKTLIDFRAQASDNSTFYVSGQMGSKAEGTWTSTSSTRDASLIFNTVLNGNNVLALTLASDKTATFAGDVEVQGDLSVTGTTITVNQTNLDVSDNVIGLNRGAGSNANDSGIIIERGSTGDNAAILWDESADRFVVGTTQDTPSVTGNSVDESDWTDADFRARNTNITGVLGVYAGSATADNIASITWSGSDVGEFYLKNNTATKIKLNSGGDSYFDGGSVGIGKTNPSAKLEIQGDGATSGLTFKTIESNNNTTFWIKDGGAVGVHYYPFVINHDHDDSTASNAIFHAKGTTGTGLFVKTDGYTGIGTTSPSRPLSVHRGSAGSVANFLHYTDASNFAGLYIDVSQASDEVILYSSGSSGGAFVFKQGNSTSLTLSTGLHATFEGNINGKGYLNLQNGYGAANGIYLYGNPAMYRQDANTLYFPLSVAEFAGNIKHQGLTPTAGTDVDQIYTASVSLTVTTSWQDTTVNAAELATGTYIVQVYTDDHGTNSIGHYTEYYSGIMSWYSSNTNSTETDEIILHRAGHAPNHGDIFLRTERTASADTSDMNLQIKTSNNASGAATYVFKFRRMI